MNLVVLVYSVNLHLLWNTYWYIPIISSSVWQILFLNIWICFQTCLHQTKWFLSSPEMFFVIFIDFGFTVFSRDFTFFILRFYILYLLIVVSFSVFFAFNIWSSFYVPRVISGKLHLRDRDKKQEMQIQKTKRHFFQVSSRNRRALLTVIDFLCVGRKRTSRVGQFVARLTEKTPTHMLLMQNSKRWSREPRLLYVAYEFQQRIVSK